MPISNFLPQEINVNTFYRVGECTIVLAGFLGRGAKISKIVVGNGVVMRAEPKFAAFVVVGMFCLPGVVLADTQPAAHTDTQTTTHHVRKVKKALPPPLPSGPRGPVPQVPLDAMPAVPPQITFHDGLLTVVAPNSTLGDILRAVRKETSADIDVPSNANERVATHLGPALPREVMAELLNGSHFNYILLGSSENANALVRVVLVAKTGPDTPDAPAQANATAPPVPAKPAEADTAEETVDEAADQAATEADQTPPDEPGAKTPQQMLQEMQQRQLQQQQNNNGQTQPTNPPGGPQIPGRQPPQPQPQSDPQ
jgi:hypothetical protein